MNFNFKEKLIYLLDLEILNAFWYRSGYAGILIEANKVDSCDSREKFEMLVNWAVDWTRKDFEILQKRVAAELAKEEG